MKYLITLGFTKSQIAELLGISRKTLYNKIGACDSMNFSDYSDITETQLDDIVRRVKFSILIMEKLWLLASVRVGALSFASNTAPG